MYQTINFFVLAVRRGVVEGPYLQQLAVKYGDGGIRSGIIFSPSLENFHNPGSRPRLLARYSLRLSHPSLLSQVMFCSDRSSSVRRKSLRRRWDSNPRGRLNPTSLAVRRFRPLSHVSNSLLTTYKIQLLRHKFNLNFNNK